MRLRPIEHVVDKEVSWGLHASDFAVEHHGDVVGYLLGKVQIVRGHDDGAAGLRVVAQGAGDDAAAGQVQALGGLIEQQ